MARRRQSQTKRPIEYYDHRDKERLNNPPVGLVTPTTDSSSGKKTYEYDPHLDPQLQWAGKAEHTSFEVPTVSLHVHERIDPRTIVEAVRKRNGDAQPEQGSLWELPEENPPVREAIEFYRHRNNWKNRLISGDSLLVMSSLLEKEGMAGKVQMVYIDPPYGLSYNSNFQPFVNKRDIKDGKDDDLTQEPEQIRAFRDTWELGIHSYLSYLRDRLLLARELLTDSGSCFLQIGDENVHLVRSLLDEVFGVENFIAQIAFAKTSGYATNFLTGVCDYILWYGKDRSQTKYRQLYSEKILGGSGASKYNRLLLPDGTIRTLTAAERSGEADIPTGARPWVDDNLTSQGNPLVTFKYERQQYSGTYKTTVSGLEKLALAKRLYTAQSTLRFIRYIDDFPVVVHNVAWMDIGGVQSRSDPKVYVVQTANEAVKRCLLMTTDPGDLIFDPTCGSGTTAYVAEQWGRRWITCDTSRVAITLAQQRLMTASYDYYELAHPKEGVGSGFKYRTVPHITLGSIANNPDIKEGMTQEEVDEAIAKHAPQETLYDQPSVDRGKRRVTGPFSVEAVPAPVVRSVVDSDEWIGNSGDGETTDANLGLEADDSIARSGETLRQGEWRDELLKTGIRGKSGQRIKFSRLEPLPGSPGLRYLHADGETLPNDEGADRFRDPVTASAAQRVVVSFGPDHAPIEQRQVARAIEEAQTLVPQPRAIVFAAFQFDPEAAKDIDETNWPNVALLKAQMNADLLTDDLKKKRASNESFWLIGQPDVAVSSEEWIVNSRGEALAPYEVVAKLSGTGGLAEINGLSRDHLSAIVAVAQRRDLWDAAAANKGGGVDSGQHSGGPSATRQRGVSALSGNREGVPCRIGDTVDFVRQLGTFTREELDKRVESVRRDRQIADGISEIASSLTLPLSTTHYSQAVVRGFDYYNTKSGDVESGGEDKIAMWMLDTDYDGRSLYPRQVFFPMAGPRDGWARLARNLKAEIDEDLIEAYRGTVSLPFEAGEHRRAAVKIVDDRGIESLRIVDLETDTPATKSNRALEEILADLSENVPAEDWAKLPNDLIDNLDHYTAGAERVDE